MNCYYDLDETGIYSHLNPLPSHTHTQNQCNKKGTLTTTICEAIVTEAITNTQHNAIIHQKEAQSY